MIWLSLLGLLHAALALRTGCSPYYVPVFIAWVGVLLAWGDRIHPAREKSSETYRAKSSETSRAQSSEASRAKSSETSRAQSSEASRAKSSETSRGKSSETSRAKSSEVFFGAALLAIGTGAAIFWSNDYAPYLRFSALFAGAGLLILLQGARALRVRELILLSLPLLSPAPKAIVQLAAPQKLTLLATSLLLPDSQVSGDLLSIPGGAIRIVKECCGLACISQLVAVALMIVCLFEMPRAKQLAVLASAVTAGFVANVSRLALLTLLSRGDFAVFEWWHSEAGEHRFTFAALAVAGLAWWLLLRERKPELREVPAR